MNYKYYLKEAEEFRGHIKGQVKAKQIYFYIYILSTLPVHTYAGINTLWIADISKSFNDSWKTSFGGINQKQEEWEKEKNVLKKEPNITKLDESLTPC